jgi:hypothetical protein
LAADNVSLAADNVSLATCRVVVAADLRPLAAERVHLDPDKSVVIPDHVVFTLCLRPLHPAFLLEAGRLVDATASLVANTEVLGPDDGPQVQVAPVGCKMDEAQIQMDEGIGLGAKDVCLENEANRLGDKVQRQATKDRYLKTRTTRRMTTARGKTNEIHRKSNDVRGETRKIIRNGNVVVVHLDAAVVQVDAPVFTMDEVLS